MSFAASRFIGSKTCSLVLGTNPFLTESPAVAACNRENRTNFGCGLTFAAFQFMPGATPQTEITHSDYDWDSLFNETMLFASKLVNRLRWRGSAHGLLPDGYDPNSIAAQAFAELFEQNLPYNRTPPISAITGPCDLRHELRRRVGKLVNRLHHRKETYLLRSEADPTPVQLDDGETVPFWQTVPAATPNPAELMLQNETLELDNLRKELEVYLGKNRRLRKVFAFHCAGISTPKALARRLKLKPALIVNLQRRLRSRVNKFLNTRILRKNKNFLQKSFN